MTDKVYVELPESNDNIKYLVIEESEPGSFFLYHHESLNNPCLYDNWFQSLEEAMAYVSEAWDVSKENWRSFEK